MMVQTMNGNAYKTKFSINKSLVYCKNFSISIIW